MYTQTRYINIILLLLMFVRYFLIHVIDTHTYIYISYIYTTYIKMSSDYATTSIMAKCADLLLRR